jgi:hypothetical protein
MNRSLGLIACSLCWFVSTSAPNQQQSIPTVQVAVIGESNLKTDFIDDLKASAPDAKVQIVVVPRSDPQRKYTLAIAQESTVGTAAAAVIVLDRDGDVATSVVRSGRFSGKGALNACAKEIAKKLATLSQ